MSLVDRRTPGRAILAVVAIPLTALGVLLIVGAARAADVGANIQGFAFSPATINVKAGDTVTWTNKDTAGHTVTSDTGAFDKPVAAGGTATVSFATAGTFAYHCNIHGGMSGTVVVAAAAASGTSAPPSTGSGLGSPRGTNYAPLFIVFGVVFVAASLSAGLAAGYARRRPRD
jgi:plastocyanin